MTLLVKQPYFFHVHKKIKRYKLRKQQSNHAKHYNPFTGFCSFLFNIVFNSIQQSLLHFANIFMSYKLRKTRVVAGNNCFNNPFGFSTIKSCVSKVFYKGGFFRIRKAHNYNIFSGIVAKLSQKSNLYSKYFESWLGERESRTAAYPNIREDRRFSKFCASKFRKAKSIVTLLIFFSSYNAIAAPCVGKFVNPAADICWSCIFPISIGSINIYSGGKEDTPNPSNPICMCGAPPRVGISIGFWEPVRLVDVTRTPYCMVSLGGFSFGNHTKKHGGVAEKTSGEALKHSFYHVHWYMYPVVYWLELLTDFLCLEEGSLDLAYLSELDPNWNNDELNAIVHPEAILFGNKIAQAACAVDCLQANLGFPSDSMYWCAGCQGGLYPFTGFIENHVGGVESSTLEVEKTIARLHRFGLAWETSGKGALCQKQVSPLIKKSQYKLQMTYPRANATGSMACNPLGRSTAIWGSGREYPSNGEDFGYLVWRKRNCCVL